jgi:ureidoacrylate peracid hydrolase
MVDRDHLYEVAGRIAHVEPLRGIARKVEPKHTALIVIDMQNDFVAEDGLMSREGWDVGHAKALAERLPPLLNAARKAGVLVVFVRNVYTTEYNYYLSDVWMEQAARRRPGGYTTMPMCEAASWGGDFYGDVRPQVRDPVVIKHRYNAFTNTDLDTILRANGIRTAVFTGVATNCCVDTTARDAFMRDYYVLIAEDGTASYDIASHEAALKNFDALFGETTDIETLLSSWRTSKV